MLMDGEGSICKQVPREGRAHWPGLWESALSMGFSQGASSRCIM